MAAYIEEINHIRLFAPNENFLGTYPCNHPNGTLYCTDNFVFFYNRDTTGKPVTSIPIKDIVRPVLVASTNSIHLETKITTHFYHSVHFAVELFYMLVGKQAGWYNEYNALLHSLFQLPATESLMECINSTISVTGIHRSRPGTLYISQNYVCFTLKLSDEKHTILISDIHTAQKENSIFTAKGIKVTTQHQEYIFSGFITQRTHVLKMITDLMNIQRLRLSEERVVTRKVLPTAESNEVLSSIEEGFTSIGEDSVQDEAKREHLVLDEAVALSKELDQQMSEFLLNVKRNGKEMEAVPVVTATQAMINSIRELGFILLLDIINDKDKIPAAIPPEGKWANEINMGGGEEEEEGESGVTTVGNRIISKTIFSKDDTLTPISGGLYTITKTILQCFLRIKKHFTTLHDHVLGKRTVLIPGWSLRKPINKLKLYNEQMALLDKLLPLIVSIALTPDSKRLQEFDVNELLETIKIKSFWYEYQPSLKTFVKLLNNVTAAFSKSYQYEYGLVKYPVAFTLGALYAFNSEGAEKRVEEVGKNLDPALAKFIWNLPDKPFIRFFDHLTIASVAVSKKFTITPTNSELGPINCHIISAKQLPHEIAHNISGKGPTKQLDKEPLSIILHFHGGGFVSMSPESHEVYLREWAHSTQTIIISVDYKQAPEYKWPIASNECFYVYEALINGFLGFSPKKITLVGDSAGGNLVAVTTLKAIANKIRIPDSAILIYPAVNLVKMATASRIINMNDPIVSYGFLQMCLDSYLPSDCDPWNMYISPLYAHEKYLRKFPTTYIMGMAFDPLLDDYVAFAKRLLALNKQVLFKLYEDMPHGVLNMVKLIPDAKKAIEDSGLWLRWSIS